LGKSKDKIFSRSQITEDKGMDVKKVFLPNWRMSDRQWVCKKLGWLTIGIARI